MANLPIDAELALLLYRLTPASLRSLMVKVARYLRSQNAARITAQANADGSAYAPRKKGSNRPMLLGYARRIRERVEMDQAVVGIFGRMGKFGSVHDAGKTERGISYPARNLMVLPEADKLVVLDMIRSHVAGGAA